MVAEAREHGRWWVSMRTAGQLRDDVNPRLASIACPTLLLSGGAAHGFLRKHEERVLATIPDVEFALVPHARTTSPFDQSQAYAEIVADFLRREALVPGNPRLRTSPRPASVRDRMRPPPPPATLGP